MASNTPILELSRSSVSMPFEIHTMDWIDKNRWEQNAEPHRHNYFVIIWVKKGSGTHLIDLHKFELHNGTVYCITPGQIHQLTSKKGAEGYVISFTAEFMGLQEESFDLLFNTGLFNSFTHAPVISVDQDMQQEMDDMATKMVKEFANFYLLRSEILKGYLKIFLIYLTRQFERPDKEEGQSKNMELTRKFLDLIEKHFVEKRMVADYADELVVTANYLNEVIKKVSGFPASHHIQQRIILEAKRLAAYSTLSMKEVAYQLGFDDIAHFSKFFKNAAGMSFTDFKKSFKEQGN
jgi:YesN/AraC family two-component response regulator